MYEKKKRGRPKKCQESEDDEAKRFKSIPNTPELVKRSGQKDKSVENISNDVENSFKNFDSPEPKRRGRSKKGLDKKVETGHNDLNEVFDKLDVSPPSKTRASSRRKHSNLPDSENKTSEVLNDSFLEAVNESLTCPKGEDLIGQNGNQGDTKVEVKKRGRPKKIASTIKLETSAEESPKTDSVQQRGRQKICSQQKCPQTESAAKKRRGRRIKSQEDTPKNEESSDYEKDNSSEESETDKESPKKKLTVSDEPRTKRGRARKSLQRYSQYNINGTQLEFSYAERIDFLTKMKNPQKTVECALCNESMAVIKYQKGHMAKHNFLCWLKDETPIDLENEIIVERILTRVKLNLPKTIFSCPLCQTEKKSARGYISHRQFCGKSQEEKLNLMISCVICGRVLMPSSMDTHVYLCHNSDNKKSDIKSEVTGSRKAAEKCLQNLSTFAEKKSKDNQIDSDDDLREFYTTLKFNQKDHMGKWKTALLKDETVSCPCPDCDFTADHLKIIKDHFRQCSQDAKKYQCSECKYTTKNEEDVVSHIKNTHSISVNVARQKINDLFKDDNFQNGLSYIPYLRYAEGAFRYCSNQSKFFIPALQWTKEQRSLNYSKDKLFPKLLVDKDEWLIRDLNELKQYVQHTDRSIQFTFDGDNWATLNKYEASLPQNNLAAIFCGGPTFGLAWAPGYGRQFLAIGAHLSMVDFYQVSSTCFGPGNIQIWSFGNLSNQTNSSFEGTRLEYLICHDFGGAWAMEWCPSGCQDDQRMGLLAVACASGSIPIFSIPIPKENEQTKFPACKPQPIFRLELGPLERYQCTKVSWSKVKPHKTIAAGFVNGYIALWDLETESFLLKKGQTLYPFKIFQAHHSIISGLTFSPASDTFLASCAHDKTVKCWDLSDTTAPLTKQGRHLATDLVWLQHWMTYAASIDSICSSADTTLSLNTVRDLVYDPHSYISSVDSVALSISGNDWMNGIALGYDNGQVNLGFGRKQIVNDDRKKYIKVIMEPTLYDFDKKEFVEKPTKKGSPSNVDDCPQYNEAANKYGIYFKTDLHMGYQDNLKGNASNPINIYPLIAANKVSWNPNINGFLNCATGYQSGLVIISRLKMTPDSQSRVDNIVDKAQ